jgi:hypothetical protein
VDKGCVGGTSSQSGVVHLIRVHRTIPNALVGHSHSAKISRARTSSKDRICVIRYGDRQGQELREMLPIVGMVQVDLHFEVAVERERWGPARWQIRRLAREINSRGWISARVEVMGIVIECWVGQGKLK